jgi:hypothetical protein
MFITYIQVLVSCEINVHDIPVESSAMRLLGLSFLLESKGEEGKSK